jgi:hypothetical protein
MPVVDTAPPVIASPYTAASRLNSDQRTPPLRAHRPRVRVDVDALHLGEVDQQRAVGDASPGDAVAAAADGDLEPALAREVDRGGDVARAPAAHDQRRPSVDEPVVDEASRLVALVAGLQHGARQALLEGIDALGVEGSRSRHLFTSRLGERRV